MTTERHELFQFMRQLSTEMRSEYERISRRSKEDPGTAGDEGEENWAALLRSWLPRPYSVVTKGRILGSDGNASPQVDVLVLSGNYPSHLLNKKMYFAGGVLAAFECKLQLRQRDLPKFFSNSKAIKYAEPRAPASPYEEFNQPILYGLLAHSHTWKRNKIDKLVFNIMEHISRQEMKYANDLGCLPDLLCIADTATYVLRKAFYFGECEDDIREMLEEMGAEAAVMHGYHAHWVDKPGDYFDGTVHGTLISYLLHKLGFSDPSIRGFAKYWRSTDIEGASIGRVASFPVDADLPLISQKFADFGGELNPWNEWGHEF